MSTSIQRERTGRKFAARPFGFSAMIKKTLSQRQLLFAADITLGCYAVNEEPSPYRSRFRKNRKNTFDHAPFIRDLSAE